MSVCILNFYLRWIKSNLKGLCALTPICGQFSSLLFFFLLKSAPPEFAFTIHHYQHYHPRNCSLGIFVC